MDQGNPMDQGWPIEERRGSGSKVPMVLGALVVCAGLGFAWKLMKPAPAPVEARNYMTSHQQLMREAMDLAREAQAAQRAHQAHMEQMIRECEQGSSWDPSQDDGFGGDGL